MANGWWPFGSWYREDATPQHEARWTMPCRFHWGSGYRTWYCFAYPPWSPKMERSCRFLTVAVLSPPRWQQFRAPVTDDAGSSRRRCSPLLRSDQPSPIWRSVSREHGFVRGTFEGTKGGGASIKAGTAAFNNSTVLDNTAPTGAGILYNNPDASVTTLNSDLQSVTPENP